MRMVLGVRIAVGVRKILSWSILVVEELWTVLELFNGIRGGHIQVPSTTGHQFQISSRAERAAFVRRSW